MASNDVPTTYVALGDQERCFNAMKNSQNSIPQQSLHEYIMYLNSKDRIFVHIFVDQIQNELANTEYK